MSRKSRPYKSRKRRPSYLGKLIGTCPPNPGEVQVVTIAHADDCDHWRHMPCDCNPAVTVESRQ